METIKAQLLTLGQSLIPGGRFDSSASMTSLPEWTSIMHIQILSEVAHRFAIDIELKEAYRLDSFERLLAYIAVQKACAAQPGPAGEMGS
ncbi:MULTISPECIES: hypothetical protein [unclassified Pseudomonas]|uniref:hypothetical protein n=1 Tax=unclassified Pseudomonas TaxID=196821 RepID=UPI001C474C66|nr:MULTISPECIES: hypothetical protein [unclassified Pseudomonas]